MIDGVFHSAYVMLHGHAFKIKTRRCFLDGLQGVTQAVNVRIIHRRMPAVHNYSRPRAYIVGRILLQRENATKQLILAESCSARRATCGKLSGYFTHLSVHSSHSYTASNRFV